MPIINIHFQIPFRLPVSAIEIGAAEFLCISVSKEILPPLSQTYLNLFLFNKSNFQVCFYISLWCSLLQRANTNPPYWSSHFKTDIVTFKTSKDQSHLLCSCVYTLRVKISTAMLVGILASDCLFIVFFTQKMSFFPALISVWKQLSKILTSTLNPSFKLVFVAMIETTCQ